MSQLDLETFANLLIYFSWGSNMQPINGHSDKKRSEYEITLGKQSQHTEA
jgi:hypothetical protein